MSHLEKRPRARKNVEVDPTAYVGDGAELGDNVKVGPFSSILSGSILEDNCIVGSHCIIGHPSKIEVQGADFSANSSKVVDFLVKEDTARLGKGSIIRSGSVIYKRVRLGGELRTGHNVLIREHVTMGENCVVGTHAILDGYIKVGNKSMIQSQCYIAQSVNIGNGVFIAPGCLFLDNKKIILGEGLAGITIEDYVRIGGGAKVLPRVNVGRCALIGAGSVVTKDIPPKAIAFGVPAKVTAYQDDDETEEYVKSVKGWQ